MARPMTLAELRARVLDPARDPFAPSDDLFRRSPLGMAVFGAAGEDLGDGPWCYEMAQGRADLDALLARPLRAPASPEEEALLARARWVQALAPAMDAAVEAELARCW